MITIVVYTKNGIFNFTSVQCMFFCVTMLGYRIQRVPVRVSRATPEQIQQAKKGLAECFTSKINGFINKYDLSSSSMEGQWIRMIDCPQLLVIENCMVKREVPQMHMIVQIIQKIPELVRPLQNLRQYLLNPDPSDAIRRG